MKTVLSNFKYQQPDIDKIYLYAENPFNQSINYLLMEEKKLELKI